MTTWHAITKTIRRQWSGLEIEEPKIVTAPKSPGFWRACCIIFRKCAIHLLPIFAACVIGGLNIGTYFVGNKFLGPKGKPWQDFAQLGLQGAAKLYEIVLVASLATILMDILRYQLIVSPNGLPLGIVTAKSLFADVTYFASPEFRHGIAGVEKKVKRLFLFLSIATCSSLALLAGPSSALLLIPQRYDDWGAGGITYSLVGSNESIWPSTLDSRSIGGPECKSPPYEELSTQMLLLPNCPWSGYQSILQSSQPLHLSQIHPTLLVQDQQFQRNMHINHLPNSAAAFGVALVPSSDCDSLYHAWNWAKSHAKTAKAGSISKYANLRYRDQDRTTASIDSQIPVVRTSCFANSSVNFADIVNKTYYPLQLEYPSDYLPSLLDDVTPHNREPVIGKQYSFNTTMSVNSSRMAAIWLETPTDEHVGTTIDGDTVTGRSSAYLNIQIPQANGTFGLHAACSIDARWVQSRISGSRSGSSDYSFVFDTPSYPIKNSSFFPASSDGKWRTVRLGIDWLNALTPRLSNMKDNAHLNTLTSTLTAAGFDNSTGLVEEWEGDTEGTISSVVSSIVADGMSRSGFEDNDPMVRETPMTRLYSGESNVLERILDGTYVLPPPINRPGQDAETYEMYVSFAVSGLGYRVNSFSYIFALAVLFLHVTLALCHTVWVIYSVNRGESPAAWSSLTDLVTLALRSTPPETSLDDASAGVNRYKTFEEPVRIRTVDFDGGDALQSGKTSGSDGVEMILGSDYSPAKHRKVIAGQSY